MSERRVAAGACAAVAAAVLLFFSPAWLGGGQFLYRDAGRHYHPTKQWLATEWRAGRFPEWNPHAGLGLPVVAGAIDSPQHPFNALFLALPFEPAFALWVVACYLLAAGGAMAWARTLGARWGAAALGGLAFGLSGFLVSSSDNHIHLASMAAAPWLLAAARRQAARGGPGPLLAVGLASFVVAAGGELLDWAVAAGLATLLARLPGPADAEPGAPAGRRWIRRGSAALAASLVGAAPALLPFLAALPDSSRAVAMDLAEAARWSLHPARLAELVVPNLTRGPLGSIRNELYQRLTGDTVPTPWTFSLYVGAPVVALALLAARRSVAGRWLVGAALLALWAAMGHHAGFGGLAARLPILSGIRYFERLAGWPTLLLGAAAALGAGALLRDAPRAGRPAAAFGIAGGALAGLGLEVQWREAAAADVLAPALGGAHPAALALAANLGEGALSAGLALALLGGVAWLVRGGRLVRAAPILLSLVVGLDLAGANARAYLLSSPALVEARQAPIPAWLAGQPDRPRITSPFALDRERWPELLPYESSWRWGARTAAASFHVAAGVRSLDTYAGVLPGRLHRFQRRVGVAARARVGGLVGVAAVVVPYRLERAAELGLTPPWRVLASDAELPAWLVEVPHRPRAYLAGELEARDADGALAFLAGADPRVEQRTALEGPVPDGYRAPAGTAAVLRDEPDRVELGVEVDGPGPGLVVLDDLYADGWRAELDGAPVVIAPANSLARAVWVPPGRHTVVFDYRTPLWREAWLLFAAGAGGLLLARARRQARID